MTILTSQIVSRGRLTNINNLYVEVWVKDAKQDYLIGAAFTDTGGHFSITYEDRDPAPPPSKDGLQESVK